MIYWDNLQVKRDATYSFQIMECTIFNLLLHSEPLHLTIIYRPPGSNINTFASEVVDVFEANINNKGIPIIIGDLNIHMNNLDSADTNTFLDILDSLDLTNRIQFPTHKSQNTIDLVISPRQSSFINSVSQGHLFWDHYFVNFQIQYTTTKPITKMITFRKLNSINPQAFGRDVRILPDDHNLVNLSPNECLKLYRTTLTAVLNTHAPEKAKKIVTRSKIPWFNDSIAKAIRHRHMAEQILANHHSDPMAFNTFYRARYIVSNLMDAAENKFYKDSLANHQGNTKEIFKICDSLLGRNQDLPLPPGFTDKEQATQFNNFFVSKIPKIWDELNINRDQLVPVNSAPIFVTPDPPIMDSFSVLSEYEVAKIIHRSPSKSCEDDPIPTTLLKNILQSVLPVLTALVNGSMQTGVFPDDLKQALVKPLLKKANLDLVDKNYQPVSNHEFAGKIIERAVTDQLTHHITKHNLMESMQSVYRKGDSMETALCRVKTDILRALDNQEVTCVLLLDLLAAFNMVHHQILINRLTSMFGISGCALALIRSYLTGRSQRVKVGESRSDSVSLHYGVPQGSVLGPILFTLYTCPLGQIFKAHRLMYHLYADDSQLYLSFRPNTLGAQSMCLETIKNYIDNVRR